MQKDYFTVWFSALVASVILIVVIGGAYVFVFYPSTLILLRMTAIGLIVLGCVIALAFTISLRSGQS